MGESVVLALAVLLGAGVFWAMRDQGADTTPPIGKDHRSLQQDPGEQPSDIEFEFDDIGDD